MILKTKALARSRWISCKVLLPLQVDFRRYGIGKQYLLPALLQITLHRLDAENRSSQVAELCSVSYAAR